MIFSISPAGNIGNRMQAYMAAQALAWRLPFPVTFNVELPEWGMVFDPVLHYRLQEDKAHTVWFHDHDGTTLDEMVARISASVPKAVVFRGYFQRFELLADAKMYGACFPPQPLDIAPFADDELVINIRAGELLAGTPYWYPLVPPFFYRTLIERTGLRPVFLGQLDNCLYVSEILRLCPGARVLPSAGAMVDFNRLRHARRLCISVSTFSWLAAWLGQAVEIHYPLLGFLHPFCMPPGWQGGGGVDLTPLSDPRYRYHLFPILNAAPELDFLRQTAILNPISQPVSPDFAASLSGRARELTGTVDNLAGSASWYIKRYPDAAWSIAQGQYGSAQAHYEQLGRFHGYQRDRMQKLDWRKARPNLALGRPALQSSASKWSRRPTPAEDAAGAVSGEIDETAAFHTDIEDTPWWRVDLGAAFSIAEIWLFNRIDTPVVALRASKLAVDIGTDEADYREVFRYESETAFGGADGRPLIIRLEPGATGRFVRVRLLTHECLHLNQVEVYGVEMQSGAS